jgi:hypothetical protein
MPSLPAPKDPQPYCASALAPLALWFTEPLGVFTRITADYVLDRDGAQLIVDGYRRGIQQLGPLPGGVKLPWVHDWTRLTRVDPKTKAQLMAFTFEIREHVASIDFVLAPHASVFLRMAASVAESTLATVGMPVRSHFEKPASEVLASLGLRLRSP